VQAAQFAFHFRKPAKLSKRSRAPRAGVALDKRFERGVIHVRRFKRQRAFAPKLGFRQLAVEGPGSFRRGFEMQRHAAGFARGQPRARGPEVRRRPRPTAVMGPSRRGFELAHRLGVIMRAVSDEAELELNLACARPVHVFGADAARALIVAHADSFGDLLHSRARGARIAFNRGRRARQDAARA